MKNLRYQLTEEEILESLLCLDYKIEGKFKQWNVLILVGIGFALFFDYWKNPELFYLVMGGFFTTILLFGIIYLPIVKRIWKAKEMASKQGTYQFGLMDQGITAGNDGLEIAFLNNKIVCFESKNVVTLQVSNQVFCIPKHVMDVLMQESLMELVKRFGGKVYHVKLEGRVNRHGKENDGKNGKSFGK